MDYEATVFMNGQQAGFNRGGYARFSVDVTEYISHGGENELYVVKASQYTKSVFTNESQTLTDWFLYMIRLIVAIM